MDTDVSLNVVLWMVASMLGSPSFSASDLMALGVDLTRVFRLAATLCERGSVDVMSVKVCEGVDVGQPMARDVVVEQPMILGVNSPWQTTTAKMDTLLAQPTIDDALPTP